MIKYKKKFYDYYGYAEDEHVPCALYHKNCRGVAVDLHHIDKKSELGVDEVWNLLPVSRYCHDYQCENRKLTPQEQHEARYRWHMTYHPDKEFPQHPQYFIHTGACRKAGKWMDSVADLGCKACQYEAVEALRNMK